MQATDILSKEHRAIEFVLETMEKAASRIEAGGDFDPSIIEDCVDFASGFADKCHHAKEEELLFPLLEARGITREGGPIGVMLEEHRKGRAFIAAMREALPKWKSGDDAARSQLVEAIRGYTELLRLHIGKEDHRLFVMAGQVVSDADDAELIKGFEDVEERKIGPGVHEAYHRMLDTLGERAKDL